MSFHEYVPLQNIYPRRIIDVGCATGAFLAGAQKQGWDCIGIDMADTALETARSDYGIRTQRGCIEDIDIPDNSTGLITMWHVLEHLVAPFGCTQEGVLSACPRRLSFH